MTTCLVCYFKSHSKSNANISLRFVLHNAISRFKLTTSDVRIVRCQVLLSGIQLQPCFFQSTLVLSECFQQVSLSNMPFCISIVVVFLFLCHVHFRFLLSLSCCLCLHARVFYTAIVVIIVIMLVALSSSSTMIIVATTFSKDILLGKFSNHKVQEVAA
jgi:hypothetical protein